MERQGVGAFKYYVGISELGQIATRQDRVCVLNILGGESSDVTPAGHVYSGGNIVFGTSPGRRGMTLDTALGPIPVYNNVREGMDDGHRFNCGVVYLPPAAARDGVAELIRVNPELDKIFIVTEKLSAHDSREIRAMGQQNRIDIFGGNSLGVADAWNQTRIGGALGGDNPVEVLKPGSIAIFSNSGGFTTTIATYIRMAGWGTTTLISSGKDIYIHYAAPEFAFALANDPRSKAAVLYVEPGGIYELDANFSKPIVACVVGRWKARLTRAVGHAGAMVGSGDDAGAKERWFMEKLGVDGIFDPENPIASPRGALVTNIAYIPAALTAVMAANGISPDFKPEGNLALKPWFGSAQGLALPPALDLPLAAAIAPYGEQIARLNRHVGAAFPRQSMKDASGATEMDPATQVTKLHGVSMLETATLPLETNLYLSLFRELATDNDRCLVDVAVGAELNLFGTPALAAADAARQAGNAPNTVLAAACSLLGPRRAAGARTAVAALIERFSEAGLEDATANAFDLSSVRDDGLRALLLGDERDEKAEAMLAGVRERGARSVVLGYLETLGGHATADGVLAAIAATLAWRPLKRKRISRLTAECAPWWLRLFGALLGASVEGRQHGPGEFCGIGTGEILGRRSLTEMAYAALLGQSPSAADLSAFQALVGLLLSNGPGTISGQGAKGAVSADGPETPERVQLNKAMVGFLTHTGFAHGGNGYEGVAFLIEQFRDTGLVDPGDPAHGIDLATLAQRYIDDYIAYKVGKKSSGELDIQKIPGINHPVFRSKAVNYDPREVYVRDLLAKRAEHNVFLDFYHVLVRTMFEKGLSRNVYSVNVDAVIAALLLKMLWQPYRSGAFSEEALETAAFTIFLYARMLGSAAEIDDHLNRGRNMDTRTPASQSRFVT